jgi:hypothetical protein
MNALRHGSVISQLENDQYDETQGDELERRDRRNWNAGIRHALDVIRLDLALTELAHAPVIRTVELERAGLDLKLKHALVGGDES